MYVTFNHALIRSSLRQISIVRDEKKQAKFTKQAIYVLALKTAPIFTSNCKQIVRK